MKKIFLLIMFSVLFVVLSYNILQMPAGLGTDSLSYNETTEHYIENTESETGVTNIIAAILTDYRSFDTLGETIVLFTSIVAVISVLRPDKKAKEEGANDE